MAQRTTRRTRHTSGVMHVRTVDHFAIVPGWVMERIDAATSGSGADLAIALYTRLALACDYSTRTLTADGRPIKQADLAAKLKMSVAKLRRLLATLEEVGAVEIQPTSTSMGRGAHVYVIHRLPPERRSDDDVQFRSDLSETDVQFRSDLSEQDRSDLSEHSYIQEVQEEESAPAAPGAYTLFGFADEEPQDPAATKTKRKSTRTSSRAYRALADGTTATGSPVGVALGKIRALSPDLDDDALAEEIRRRIAQYKTWSTDGRTYTCSPGAIAKWWTRLGEELAAPTRHSRRGPAETVDTWADQPTGVTHIPASLAALLKESA